MSSMVSRLNLRKLKGCIKMHMALAIYVLIHSLIELDVWMLVAM